MPKTEYINEINRLLNETNDLALLDLIMKLLQKSSQQPLNACNLGGVKTA